MEIIYGPRFVRSAKKLPEQVKLRLVKKLELLRKNPADPMLHSKMLAGKLAGFFSFRLTRDWRVIYGYVAHNTIQLYLVAHRKDIYKGR